MMKFCHFGDDKDKLKPLIDWMGEKIDSERAEKVVWGKFDVKYNGRSLLNIGNHNALHPK